MLINNKNDNITDNRKQNNNDDFQDNRKQNNNDDFQVTELRKQAKLDYSSHFRLKTKSPILLQNRYSNLDFPTDAVDDNESCNSLSTATVTAPSSNQKTKNSRIEIYMTNFLKEILTLVIERQFLETAVMQM